MKNYIVPPLRLLAKLVLLTSIIVGFLFLKLSLETPQNTPIPLAYLIKILLLVGPLIIALGIVSSLFSSLAMEKGRLVARFIFLLIGFSFFIAIFTLWPLFKAEESPNQRVVGRYTENTIYGTADKPVYIVDQTLESGVYFATEPLDQGLLPLTVGPISSVMLGTEPRKQIGQIDSMVQFVGITMERFFILTTSSWFLTVIYSFLLATSLAGMWAIVRLTRWPLFNSFLSLAALFGIFWLMVIFLDPTMQGVLASFHPYAPVMGLAVTLAVPTLILVVLPVLLPPFKDWKRQVQ